MRFSKNRLSIIGVVMALIFGLVAIVPAMAAATGTIALDKTYASPTGSVKITVTDADLDTVTAVKQDVTFTAAGDGATQNVTLTAAAVSGVEISGTPVVLDNDGTNTKADGSTATGNTTDVDESTNFKVTVFDASTGLVVIQAFSTADGKNGDTSSSAVSYVLTLSYNTATAQTTAATVTSPSDTTGVSITLTETGVSTGKFEGTFTVGAGASTGAQIQAVAGQVITVKYTDASPAGTRSTTITVEGTKPAATVVGPTNSSFTTSLTPKLQVDFTDSDSGVDTATGKIVFTIVKAEDDLGNDVTSAITGEGTVSTSTITNGYRASVTLGGISTARTVKITWRATADDKAGNTGQTDSATTTGNQDHVVIIDNLSPNFAGATALAGQWWDTSLTTTDKTQTTVTKSSNTTIAVVLPLIIDLTLAADDVKESLDGTTVAVTDFEIDGLKKADGTTVNDVTPTAAVVYSGALNTVFLTVPAMASDATPTVVLKGVIADTAGNTVATGSVNATDEMAPVLTASLSASMDKDKVTVTVTADENLSTAPTVVANSANTNAVTVSGTLSSTRTWTAVMDPATDGVYAVTISGTDVGQNISTLGNVLTTAKFPTSASIVFYVDSALASPVVTPADAASAEVTEPFFITIDFAAEGAEYGLTSATPGVMTITAGDVATDLDVNATVTVNSATLDGVDVTADLSTLNSIKYDLAVVGIATGAHKLVILATDEAGNTLGTTGVTINFTVTARAQYSVPLTTGWNLVSIPADPVDSSIDSVVPSTHPATQILTYDPSDANGPWLVATRATDGTWTGTLTTIDSGHAYWVNTASAAPIKTLLGVPSLAQAILPTIPVVTGWNLLPIVDLEQTAAGDLRTAGTYFTSITWKVVYGYGTTGFTGRWERVATGDNVETGRGYWVWASAAGTLVP